MANDLLERIQVTEKAISDKEEEKIKLLDERQKSEDRFNTKLEQNRHSIEHLRERKYRLCREQYKDCNKRATLIEFGLNSNDAELTNSSLIVKESDNVLNETTFDALFQLEKASREEELRNINSSKNMINDNFERKEQSLDNEDNYALNTDNNQQQEEVNDMASSDLKKNQSPLKKVFISHASKDISAIKNIVELLELIGFDKSSMFCSSIEPYGIPTHMDIYEYLKNQFNEFDLHVIFVLSPNYYNSVACLNEMGAAWVLSCSKTVMLLPGFNFSDINGAINPRQIAIQFKDGMNEDELYNLKSRVSNFIKEMAHICNNSHIIREERRDSFICAMNAYTDATSSN